MLFREQLTELSACQSAVEWVGDKTLAQAWGCCLLPTWMAWIVDEGKRLIPELPGDREVLEAAIEIATMVLPQANAGERTIYEAAIEGSAWAHGDRQFSALSWARVKLHTDPFMREKSAIREVFRNLTQVRSERRCPRIDPDDGCWAFERLVHYAAQALSKPHCTDATNVQLSNFLRERFPLHRTSKV